MGQPDWNFGPQYRKCTLGMKDFSVLFVRNKGPSISRTLRNIKVSGVTVRQKMSYFTKKALPCEISKPFYLIGLLRKLKEKLRWIIFYIVEILFSKTFNELVSQNEAS